ncbi:MAG: virulence RhuM family protein [Melioribacteraceae bacterium]|nr:virulence RhuM family protein [Melioribacteraceae bacterium]
MTKKTKLTIRNSTAEFLIFTSQDGKNSIEARYEDETIWLTQKLMGELFQVGTNTINYHLKEIFKNDEVDENSVVRKFRITASDGKNYNTNFYNLDAIISVGYRVNSLRATQFRQWATQIAKEKAETEFEKYRIVQDSLFESDFDKEIKKLLDNGEL